MPDFEAQCVALQKQLKLLECQQAEEESHMHAVHEEQEKAKCEAREKVVEATTRECECR